MAERQGSAMRLRLAPLVLGMALSLGTSLGVGEGSAHAGPDPGKLKAAAESFEAGARAFKEKKFQEAAAHFEAADSAVPGPKALRLAMRARDEAGQASRAATLAALGLDRHSDDAETRELANEILGKYAKTLQKVEISCVSPCLLAVGTHIVHGEASTRRVDASASPSIPSAAAAEAEAIAQRQVKTYQRYRSGKK